jgi:hypothetical protein
MTIMSEHSIAIGSSHSERRNKSEKEPAINRLAPLVFCGPALSEDSSREETGGFTWWPPSKRDVCGSVGPGTRVDWAIVDLISLYGKPETPWMLTLRLPE